MEWVFTDTEALARMDEGSSSTDSSPNPELRAPVRGTLPEQLRGKSLGWTYPGCSHLSFLSFQSHESIVRRVHSSLRTPAWASLVSRKPPEVLSERIPELTFGRQLIAAIELPCLGPQAPLSTIYVLRDLLRVEVLVIVAQQRANVTSAVARVHLLDKLFS